MAWRLRKIRNLRQDDWSPGTVLNPGPTEHKEACYHLNRDLRSKFCSEGSIMKDNAEIANFVVKKNMFMYYDTVHNCDLFSFEYLTGLHV